MKKGDWIDTPRFCKVRIEKVFQSETTARKYGFTVSTEYNRYDGYGILGKTIGRDTMIFAAYKK